MLSDLIGIKFAESRFGTTKPRVLRVTEPDGPSTDGGLKARQSLLLVPEGSDTTASSIVVGWIDTSKRSAELRSYQAISQAYQARYGSQPDLSRGEYERCVQELHEFFRAQAIDSRVAVAPGRRSQPPTLSGETPAPSDRTLSIIVSALSFVLGFVLCYILFRAGVLGAG